MHERRIEGAVAVITGAGGGLGAAYGRARAAAGARVALLDVDGEAARARAAEITARGGHASATTCDVTSEAQCRAAIAAVVTREGGIDLLINNAGISHRSAFADTDASVFRRVMDVNFFGALYCTQAALESLRQRRGLVVAVSSIAGFAPLFGRTGYSAAKHAVHGLFESLRCELAGSGVEVLIVCPGFTATGIGAAALDGDGQRTRHPQSTVGRVAQPDDVAAAVVRAVRRRQRLLVLTPAGKASWWLSRLSPSLYAWLMTRSLRRELER
ncbi:MAG: SDR family oxidoreductase [Candidatus Binatia bacterium]